MEPLGAGDPRQIGAYRLLGRLGAGGMGRVYLGRTAGGRTVAVKLVRTDLADDTDFRARFRQEVAAARRVGGVWTAPVLDADTESEQPWVATGYVPGPGLDVAVRDFGVLPEDSVRMLGVGLADSLAAVHATGLVHRDLKPSNVLLTLDGPRLIDFGIARALDAATALTRSGYVVGSPGYMSPEQGAGEAAGPASDVFALGGVLAFATTGAGPFGDSGTSPVLLLYRVLHEAPRLEGFPDGPLRAAVERCLAKEPGDRPSLEELRAVLGGVGPSDGWLPPLLVASVGRRTAELLDLETVGEAVTPVPGGFGPAPVMDATPVPGAGAGAGAGTGAGVGAASVSDTPPMAAPPTRQQPPPPLPQSSRGRTPVLVGGVVLLVVLAAVLVPLLLHKNGGTGSTGGSLGTGTVTATATASTTPSTSPSGTASATTSASAAGTPTAAGPTPPAAPSPGPTSPNAVPAVFLGTWTGTLVTSDGLLSEPYAIAIRPGPVGAENTTSITTVTGLAGLSCLGGDRLVSSTASSITFKDRLLPGSSTGSCSATSDTQVFTLNPDGTLHYQDNGAGSGTPSGDLHKAG
ncbi:serine/threonine-protein kinase [Streptacidiphilus sp. N1-10]|uniref:Serine/threonine-protein kinase n=1 Tax=Streptacidiphilus jeojiensis TaxID=3229225 RepID=A0ABV6XI58_9ACTN